MFPSIPKGDIVGIIDFVLSLMENWIKHRQCIEDHTDINLRRDNIVGCVEDIAQGAKESSMNLKLMRGSVLVCIESECTALRPLERLKGNLRMEEWYKGSAIGTEFPIDQL